MSYDTGMFEHDVPMDSALEEAWFDGAFTLPTRTDP